MGLEGVMRNGFIAATAVAAATMWCDGAAAASQQVLYSFPDGQPEAGVVSDAAGNLYGVTPRGGAEGKGMVYMLTPNADRSAWSMSVLHEFCTTSKRYCGRGSKPVGRLVMDVDGNLFGVTQDGGRNGGGGTVYELKPGASRTVWQHVLLHSFCDSCRTDGSKPNAGLTYAGAVSGALYDGRSPLYGTTMFGGVAAGTAFKIGGPRHRTETVIHQFLFAIGDGGAPMSELLMDRKGDLYGTTNIGGAHGMGTAFKLKHGSREASMLYDFCAAAGCADGAYPISRLTVDAEGNFYGVTTGGGVACSPSIFGCGVAYRLSRSGGSWHETVLHTFCRLADCTDGAVPVSGLSLDESANLYGATYYGGENLGGANLGGGTVFKLTASSFNILYSLCSLARCIDGRNPGHSSNGGNDLFVDSAHHVFGTTYGGGDLTQGTLFEVSP